MVAQHDQARRRTAALDYAADGIRVNALASDPVPTEQLQQAGEHVQEHAARGLPIKRRSVDMKNPPSLVGRTPTPLPIRRFQYD